MEKTSSLPLADLQQQLRRVFTDSRGVRAALEDQPSTVGLLVDAPPLPVKDRIGVYSDAYFLRILDALETDFPATRRVLGEDDFKHLAADYLLKHPSSSPNISDIGAFLPAFVRTHAASGRLPFLSELIALEWDVLLSLYTDRLPPLDTASLQAIPEAAWPKARLLLDPTTRLIKTGWAVDKLWDKHREPAKNGSRRLTRPNPRFLLLYRDDGVQLRVIDEPRWFALKRLQEGATLGGVCDELPRRFPGIALPVMEWFSHWVGAGLIKKVAL